MPKMLRHDRRRLRLQFKRRALRIVRDVIKRRVPQELKIGRFSCPPVLGCVIQKATKNSIPATGALEFGLGIDEYNMLATRNDAAVNHGRLGRRVQSLAALYGLLERIKELDINKNFIVDGRTN